MIKVPEGLVIFGSKKCGMQHLTRVLIGQILVSLNGRGIVRLNEILLNSKAGIEIRSGSDPVIERNKLAKVTFSFAAVDS